MFTTLAGCGARALRTLACVLTVAAAATAGPALAVPLPGGGRPVTITAREQPIAAFLQDLFGQMDLAANISPGLAGSVNGTFSGPAEKVLRDVARVYNLVPYFDGAVMHVVPAAELSRRTFAVGGALAERAMREVADLGLADARNAVSRTREGTMVAVGTKRFLEQIDEVVRAASAPQAAGAPTASGTAPAGSADFRVFYLRYAWAQDTTMNLGGRQITVPGVASILRSLVGVTTGGSLGREVVNKPTVPSLKGQGLAGQGTPVRQADDGAARNAAADLLVAALQRTAVAPAAEAAPAPTTRPEAHQVRIEADPRLNAIIVRDLAERLPRYEQLIAALDVEPQSLEIEATIIDVNTDKLRELGVNWRFNNAGNELGVSGSVPATGIGGVASVVLGSASQFLARIRALQSEGAARVVSSPQVVTLSNVEAVFDNSSTFFVRVAGREQVDLFNVSAGTSLRVTPHVFRDRGQARIKLLVNVEDGNLSNRQVDQIPIVDRSTINTQALITEGESLLIGGMVREATTSSTDKVPGLGDVPVVGHLFKSTTNATARIERMFLITPRLATSSREPAQPAPSSLRTEVAAPAVQPATAGRAAPATPAVAPAPVPAVYLPPRRQSIEVDLGAPTAPGPVPVVAPAPRAPSSDSRRASPDIRLGAVTANAGR